MRSFFSAVRLLAVVIALTCCNKAADNGNGQAAPSSGTFLRLDTGFTVCGIRTDDTLYCLAHTPDPPSGTFEQIFLSKAWQEGGPDGRVGASHACGLRTDGTVACWGSYIR